MFLTESGRSLLEIFLLTILIYPFIQVTMGTRSMQLFKGVAFVLIIFFFAKKLDLAVLHWILTRLFGYSIVLFLILFQPELRKLFSEIGQNRLIHNKSKGKKFIYAISRAAYILAKKKIGALIVIEKNVGLLEYVRTGVTLDAEISENLLISTFMPVSPLHDGAVIVRGDRVVAASCLLPLTQTEFRLELGTRHKAALGLSEETDAFIIVVSGETGVVSAVKDGKITRDLDMEDFETLLSQEFFQ